MQPSSLLINYLNTDLILVHAQISSRKKLLQEIAKLLTSTLDSEVSEKEIYHSLLEREKLGNTGIGNGVALPHSRTDFTDKAVIAIITLEQAIDYESLDRQAVDLAFGLLVPQQATQEHLNLLSEIAQMMSNTDYKSRLINAASPSQIIELIHGWSLQKHPP